jgi:hypothetical protein
VTVSPLCRPSWAWPLGLPVPELPDFVVVEVENAREVQLRDLRDHGIYLRLETGVAKHYMVDLLMNGDMLFQSASKGMDHGGARRLQDGVPGRHVRRKRLPEDPAERRLAGRGPGQRPRGQGAVHQVRQDLPGVHYLIKASRWLDNTEVRNKTSEFPGAKVEMPSLIIEIFQRVFTFRCSILILFTF